MTDALRDGGLARYTATAPGGLPAASEFAEYERAMPGAGERILALAERSVDEGVAIAAAERERLDIADKREHLTRRLGQGFAVVLSLAAVFVGSGVLFLTGTWLGGLIAVGVPFVAMFALAMVTLRRR